MPEYTQDFADLSGDVCNSRLAKLGALGGSGDRPTFAGKFWRRILEEQTNEKTTKFIHAAFAVAIFTIGALTATGALNDLFVSIGGDGSNGGGFIYKYTPDGVQSIFASGLSNPRGVAFDRSGNLFVANSTYDDVTQTYQGSVIKITPGGVQSLFATIQGDHIFEDLAFDRQGNLFVASRDQNQDLHGPSSIYKFTPDGV